MKGSLNELLSQGGCKAPVPTPGQAPALGRKRVLTFIAACFYFSGLVKLARWWTRRSGQHLVILNYHRATGGDLHSHLLYLRRHYRILHFEEALQELYSPCKQEQGMRDRRIPLVLTFDDGYHDNYTHGFALARELQVPMTFFLIPGYIDSGEYFWWKEGKRLVHRAQVDKVTIEGRTYHLDQPAEKKAVALAIDTHLRYATSVVEREARLATIRKALVVPSEVTLEEEAMQPLTWAEVYKMEESGWVSFGAHTMHHHILAYLTDPQEVQQEVARCRELLELHLGHPVRSFAYPVGQLQHVGAAVHAVRQAGYNWACLTRYGFNTRRSDPYLLRRIEVDVSQHWLVVAAEAAGLWGFFSRLRWLPIIRKHLKN